MKRWVLRILIGLVLCSCTYAQKIEEIRFHGNHSIPDQDLLKIIEVKPGDQFSDSLALQIEEKLRKSNRFEVIQIKKRYQGLSVDSPVVLIVSVKEKVAVKKKFMFFPVVSVSDEYGWTFGGKITSVDLLGAKERITYPLTVRGINQAAAKAIFPLDPDFSTLIKADFGISSKKNPRYLIDEQRTEAIAGIQKKFGKVKLDFDGGWSDVRFGETKDQLVSIGAGFTVDFRKQEVLPRNAFFAEIGWRRSNILDGGIHFSQYSADVRGYKSLGRIVLAGQVAYLGADRSLPQYQKPFLGGSSTLRGWKAGSFVGDNRLIGSAEIRVPFTSPISPAKVGIHGFFDTGTVWDHGATLQKSKFRNGTGAGFFVFVFGIGFKLDVGYDLVENVRVHFNTSFRF